MGGGARELSSEGGWAPAWFISVNLTCHTKTCESAAEHRRGEQGSVSPHASLTTALCHMCPHPPFLPAQGTPQQLTHHLQHITTSNTILVFHQPGYNRQGPLRQSFSSSRSQTLQQEGRGQSALPLPQGRGGGRSSSVLTKPATASPRFGAFSEQPQANRTKSSSVL